MKNTHPENITALFRDQALGVKDNTYMLLTSDHGCVQRCAAAAFGILCSTLQRAWPKVGAVSFPMEWKR